jgi:carboxynorspermidine decarboxylase
MSVAAPEWLSRIGELVTPCYVIDTGLLATNLHVLTDLQRRAGCKILLALKGFAMWSVFDRVDRQLSGAAASSLHEARLAREFFSGEVHLCAPAYREDEFDEFLPLVDHVVFNSFGQWDRYRKRVQECSHSIRCGLRLNPEHSEVTTAIYDPCSRGSRLGITWENFKGRNLDGISGLHFHTLCELNSDALERTIAAVENGFQDALDRVQWVNFGGGHHITRADYDIDRLCRLITDIKGRYQVEVYLEPGEAIALNTGFLICSVLDIVRNDIAIAILDTSAAAHMPDVLEMPYRPVITGGDLPGRKPYIYRLAGPTCLAGDIIGDYSFDRPLKAGDRLVLHDMAHYTMVKNTMFNGINLPDIVIYDPSMKRFEVQRRFTYQDYKTRLS